MRTGTGDLDAGGCTLATKHELLLQVFAEEAADLLAAMEEALGAQELLAESERLRTLFRVAHTLKGNAASLGFMALTDYANAVEELMEGVLKRRLDLDEALVALLRDAAGDLRELTRAALGGEEQLSPTQRLALERLCSHGVLARGLRRA